ncbi:Oxoglutarate/iron-dependent dioxygenase [Corchorus capsularis]|uniref:Oxoglutarate/iron-dependent dioxygenase n=1 Tax=Corchorus capsularis TaxID=210143 RepID=A0A1R3IP61_COCAP|nr:Oxoglutarate/iron-dependent dioxygenase [Corchorus capsularis]
MEEYGRHQARLARTIYEALSKNLNLDPVKTKSYLSEATGFIRVHRYPGIAEGSQAWGVGAISEDEYLSVKHRVRVNKQEDRISLNYFVFPDYDTVIQSSKYGPFTYTDFCEQAQKDFETVGFKIGLAGFKSNRAIN